MQRWRMQWRCRGGCEQRRLHAELIDAYIDVPGAEVEAEEVAEVAEVVVEAVEEEEEEG